MPHVDLLPPALEDAREVRCIERFNPEVLSRVNIYQFEVDQQVELTATASFTLFRGKNFDFTDNAGNLQFKMKRSVRWLIFNDLRVFRPDGALVGRIRQRVTLQELKFTVTDANGRFRFELFQPAETYGSFFARVEGYEIGSIHRETKVSRAQLLQSALSPVLTGDLVRSTPRFNDEFRIEVTGEMTPVDRTLFFAAGVFIDRVYFTRDDTLE